MLKFMTLGPHPSLEVNVRLGCMGQDLLSFQEVVSPEVRSKIDVRIELDSGYLPVDRPGEHAERPGCL